MKISFKRVQEINKAFENNPYIKRELQEAISNKKINVRKQVLKNKSSQ